MKHRVTRSDVVWGYLSQILNMASSLILLPFILYFLNQEDVGVWYVFITFIGLVQLLEFGFLPTISRYISYVFAGANDISDKNIPDSEVGGDVNLNLLSNIIYASRKVYLAVAVVSFFIISIIGTFYLSTLDYSGDKNDLYISWLIYGSATVIIFYFGYYNALLKGRGDQTQLNKVIVFSKLANVLCSIPLLYYGYGLLSLSLGMLCSAIVDRVLVRLSVFDSRATETIQAFKLNMTQDYTRVIWNNAKRMGVVQLGNFLTVRGSVLIVSSIVGLNAAAMYGFTLQITSIAVIVSSMYFGLQLPYMNAEQVRGNVDGIKKVFCRSLGLAWVLFLSFSLLLVMLGPYILEAISQSTKLLPINILIIFLIAAFLEMNHSLCTAFLTTKNDIIFMWPLFITGVLITAFSIIFAHFYGLWGVVLSQFILQLIYNNWKWPLLVFRELNIGALKPLTSLVK
ncbi:O-unit flippase-like protein [Vibrio diabolicus]|uniref:O-unit flippase-like protein n=1 Tax=Vibrio diabolicus TaxID=50719 RepID=UPI003750E67B